MSGPVIERFPSSARVTVGDRTLSVRVEGPDWWPVYSLHNERGRWLRNVHSVEDGITKARAILAGRG